MSKTNMKSWVAPAIHSVEKMKHAESGSGTGLPKGPTSIEFAFNGPGS